MKQAIFGLGCFWGVQKFFDSIPGVLETEVGYAGGKQDHASYEDIGDHSEVIHITYDESLVSYTELLKKFTEKRDPSFPSYKTQYDSLVLYNNEAEKDIAQKFFEELDTESERNINVRIEPQGLYFTAEERHQKYYLKH